MFRIPGRIQSAFLEIRIRRFQNAAKSLVNQGWRGIASLASTLQIDTRGQPPGRDKKKQQGDSRCPITSSGFADSPRFDLSRHGARKARPSA
ncbi:hypothetical protein [Burkholderia sp. Ax-1719]|uniref:hypothetical protein n=1 Tax=Burkholderia sp. Ax-1719 TaxID=2608334 RepID=UPI00141F2E69|nr:hypothetical protein [Burkholderia sp. Ax-1719]NIE66793.1 hypothetical protein [Burkholderia sp. Ax-1719]